MSTGGHDQSSSSGFHRRAFLKGSGAAAAATALVAQPVMGAESDQETPIVGPGMHKLVLSVNGQDCPVEIEPRTTLMEVLRYQLNLSGCKPVSNQGVTGGSTVWVDGKTVSASTTLAITCAGKKIRTVESLGGDQPDAVVQAFVHHDGMQCGFCTPGFVVAVRAFLDKHPNATEADIRAGLNGNLCRCGTYANVIQAALEVVKGGGNG
ncbi:MAG: (2Fe-2S)-binding protein [Pirellulales bacterium]|nr:(2Fe-2S)-binding protein [Pirellulales bacterium]